MTRAKDISKIVTDANLSGTLDVAGTVTAGAVAVEGASGAQITITDNSPSTVSLYMGAGNSSVSIGSTTSDPLTFLTANTERMRIDSSGNVGIGTTQPFTSRNHGVTISGTSPTLYLEDTDSGSYTNCQLAFLGGEFSIYTGTRSGTGTSNSVQRLTIDSSGRVGIGASNNGDYHANNDDLLISTSGSTGITIASGTLDQGRIAFADGTSDSADEIRGLLMYNHNGNSMSFFTNATERMRINSAGSVSIGTSSSPNNAPLLIKCATDDNIRISQQTHASIQAVNDAASAFTELKLDGSTLLLNSQSGGNVGIGTDSPTVKLDIVDDGVQLRLANSTTGTTTSDGSRIQLSGNDLLLINRESANMQFYTADTERMRITSAGAMTMGTTTSQTAVSGITLKNDVQSGYPTLLFLQNQPGTGGTMGADIHMGYASDYGSILRFTGNPFSTRPGGFQFRRVTGSGTSDLSMEIANNGDVYVPGVYANTTGNGANVFVGSDGQLERSTSSQRYKNTINDATHGLTELLTLRPVTYKGNNDGDTVYGGLIAEEVHDAGLTEFVQYNDDGEPDALAYGNMVSLCIKAIQELKAELDSAKARITALENGE